jgi:hypothetical protein
MTRAIFILRLIMKAFLQDIEARSRNRKELRKLIRLVKINGKRKALIRL